MDRIDLPLVAAVDQVLHHRVADLAVLRRGADHGHGLGLHDPVHVADDVLVLRPVARGRRVPVAHDAHVRGGRTLRSGEHRVQIHLGDLGEIRDELRHALDDARERLAVDCGGATHAFEDRRSGNAVEHRQGVGFGRRCEPERHVLQHLDQHAAEPEGHELAERGIGHRADDHLLTPDEHLLHLHAQEIGLAVVLLRLGHDGVEAFADLRCRLESDQHAPCFGLMENLGRDDLHDHGISHAGGELRSSCRGCRNALLRNGNPVGVTDELAFRRGQRRTPLRFRLVQNAPHCRLLVCHRGSSRKFDGDRTVPATVRIERQITF